jgi:DNA-binding FadR family transcriptional regulator
MSSKAKSSWFPSGSSLTFGLLEILGRGIVAGDFDEGGFPTEGNLVEVHQVSRTVVREASKMLSAKGLLESRPRFGSKIRSIADWNIFDVDVLRWLQARPFSVSLLRGFTEFRLAVEPEAAALAAIRANDQDHAIMRSALARMTAASRELDDPYIAQLSFHSAILKAANSILYLKFKDVTSTALSKSAQLIFSLRAHNYDLDIYENILAAILSHNRERARSELRIAIQEDLNLVNKVEKDPSHNG